MTDFRFSPDPATERDMQDVLAAILADDAGDAPGSRYGTHAGSWAPVAAATALVIARDTGDPLRDPDGSVDVSYGSVVYSAVSAVVNDSPDPADLLADSCGDWRGAVNVDAAELLGDAFPVRDEWLAAARDRGADAVWAAASWAAGGNTDAAHIARLLVMLEDGDPEVWDYLPPAPNLAGEFADDPTPLSLAREIVGRDDVPDVVVDALADAFEAAVSETFEDECARELRAWSGDDDR